MDFRGLGPRSKSDRRFLGHCAFLRRFGTEPRNRVWGVTVRLLWVRNFETTKNRTAQWFDVNFRSLRAISKFGRSFLGHCAFLSTFLDGTKKPSLGRHGSAFVGKKLRDHSESDHPVARCGLSRPRTPFQVRPSLSRPLCYSSAFWDGTKKPSLGHHRSAFVGKKLQDHSESDHPVVRYELSRPLTPF